LTEDLKFLGWSFEKRISDKKFYLSSSSGFHFQGKFYEYMENPV